MPKTNTVAHPLGAAIDTLPQETDSSSDVFPATPLPENKVFYPALDGLRALAVLLVFANHYLVDITPVPLRWGWTGVDIFFVLSGFLITGILYDTRDTSHRYRNFYVRRTLRIFPLYYGVLLAVVLLEPFVRWSWHYAELLWTVYLGNLVSLVHYRHPWRNWTLFTQRRGLPLMIEHLWSLSVEEQFYLVWPVVIFRLRHRKQLLKLSFVVIGLVPLLRLLAYFLSPPELLAADFLYRATPFRVDALVMGAVVALLLRGPKADLIRSKAKPLLALSFAAMVVTWLVIGRILASKIGPAWIAFAGFTFVDLAAASLLVLSLQTGSLLYRVLSIRPLRALGRVSYGFYIFHEILHAYYIVLARKVFGAYPSHMYPLTAITAFLGTLAISLLSFHFFETPFLRLKDRFTI